ncbi:MULTISPECIES: hypothetical protein [Enterobacter]|nr:MULTISPECIES: hypothetical protein [Enterobacter]NMD68616.1 hypothetical protein [Enterobacter sp. DNRA5]
MKQLLNQRGPRGVPLLLVTINGNEHIISGHDLYGGAQGMRAALDALAKQ